MSLEPATVGTSLEAIRAELARGRLATSTFNLIVWIDDPARRDWIRERAGMLSEKHPSFTLILDNTGVRAGDATVTTGARHPHETIAVVLQHPPRLGQRAVFRRAVEQLLAEVELEAAHGLADRRLRTVDLGGGPRKAPLLGHCEKGLEGSDVHKFALLYRNDYHFDF